MLLRGSVVVVAAMLAQPAFSFGWTTCPSGTYIDAQGHCQTCPDGSYNLLGAFSNKQTSCTPCLAGQQSNSAHTWCTDCPDGQFSTGGSQCQKCPAGQTDANFHKSCRKCGEGEFNPTPGGTCSKCPAGTFNNVKGAKECCQCCAGYYSVNDRKSCQRCSPLSGSNGKPFSPPGSDSSSDCQKDQGSLPTPPTSCGMQADNVCPNPSGGGPVGSPIARKKRDVMCTKGFEACPRYSGRGGFDCVDTENDAEACGGCIGLDGEGPGADCTAIKGVNVARCVKRSCVIDSCRKGWVKSIDGSSCVLASRATGSSADSDALSVQDADAQNKRSSTKRAIRANIL